VGLTLAPNPPLTDHANTALLILGLMLMVGAAPFSGGLRQWLLHSRARLALLAVTCVVPALVAALVNTLGVISGLHEGPSAGIALGAFGALTLVVGALAQLRASGWRDLAADGAIADLGLALVGIGSFEITGLQGAALALLVMAVARPFLYLLDDIEMSGNWAWLGAGAAIFAAAGLPPTVGFAARLLVLAAAFRLHPLVATVVVTGVVIEVFATARLLLRLGIPRARPGRPMAPTAAMVASAAIALVCIATGLAPKAMLTYVWGLG
jgi:formate hydrogenlyase subunit 3/multisubunit Na+/H+ antiporter MnhD subunit